MFRIKINPEVEQIKIDFFTKSGKLLATGYERIVIGERGPYIEFSNQHIIFDHIFPPLGEKHRIGNDTYYYDEYRSVENYVKIYHQKRTVKYADYKIGFYYISPAELYVKVNKKLLCILSTKQIVLDRFM